MMDDDKDQNNESPNGKLDNSAFDEYYKENGFWTSGELIKAVRTLADNFTSFKN